MIDHLHMVLLACGNPRLPDVVRSTVFSAQHTQGKRGWHNAAIHSDELPILNHADKPQTWRENGPRLRVFHSGTSSSTCITILQPRVSKTAVGIRPGRAAAGRADRIRKRRSNEKDTPQIPNRHEFRFRTWAATIDSVARLVQLHVTAKTVPVTEITDNLDTFF